MDGSTRQMCVNILFVFHQFKFPSAAYVKAQAGGANTHVDVHIHVPDSMKRRTEGLCGFFDGNKYNDLTEPSGTVKPFEHTPVRFSETWRYYSFTELLVDETRFEIEVSI